MKFLSRVRFGKWREENKVIEKKPPSASLEGKNANSKGIREKWKTIIGTITSVTASMIFFYFRIYCIEFTLISPKAENEWGMAW